MKGRVQRRCLKESKIDTLAEITDKSFSCNLGFLRCVKAKTMEVIASRQILPCPTNNMTRTHHAHVPMEWPKSTNPGIILVKVWKNRTSTPHCLGRAQPDRGGFCMRCVGRPHSHDGRSTMPRKNELVNMFGHLNGLGNPLTCSLKKCASQYRKYSCKIIPQKKRVTILWITPQRLSPKNWSTGPHPPNGAPPRSTSRHGHRCPHFCGVAMQRSEGLFRQEVKHAWTHFHTPAHMHTCTTNVSHNQTRTTPALPLCNQ